MAILIDPVEVAGLVTREVRSGSRDGVPTAVAVARRTYPTDRADLWDALTDIERIPRWFLPISGDLQVGGRYQLEGNAGGVVERCEAPERFTVTWEMGPQVSWLEVVLTPDGDGTQLELVHEAKLDPEVPWPYGPGGVGVGWDLALMALGLHVASGQAVDPAEGLAFPTTPEGKAFVRAAALGWADAAIGNGDDPAAAREAAELTIGFYTTEPENGPAS
ncbi:SRPBCC family protein [Nocardia transvalensis]|uniref:SRPBCC family protein n=1 Tax=Nocardia transvalensis TaxID=37333 RepID=UPI00189521F1|nr:SRPBCC family protein [Nocardia transvalensis]MBF6328059.1 SRPBCC family protein [Nocardia transvalensis]